MTLDENTLRTIIAQVINEMGSEAGDASSPAGAPKNEAGLTSRPRTSA